MERNCPNLKGQCHKILIFFWLKIFDLGPYTNWQKLFQEIICFREDIRENSQENVLSCAEIVVDYVDKVFGCVYTSNIAIV